jgi:hypothetical protein
MGNTIQPNKAGLALGGLLGIIHLGWALLVAFGWAQPLINFVFWLHFIKPIYLIEPFNAGTAALLVAITALSGYVMGFIFALLWNHFHR